MGLTLCSCFHHDCSFSTGIHTYSCPLNIPLLWLRCYALRKNSPAFEKFVTEYIYVLGYKLSIRWESLLEVSRSQAIHLHAHPHSVRGMCVPIEGSAKRR
jgi:hypothetical protein